MATKNTQLVIGSGEVYFDPFDADTMTGEGEIYLGNTPDFSYTRSLTVAQEKDSYDGRLQSKEGKVLEESFTCAFTCDDIEADLVGLWFGGLPDRTILSPEEKVESFVIRLGRYYQLGKFPDSPMGLRGMSEITVTVDGYPVDPVTNFYLDLEAGRVQPLPNAPDIFSGQLATFTYAAPATSAVVIKSKPRELFGALRFVCTNAIGPKKNVWIPCVKLTSASDTALKGDTWQTYSFGAEARRLNPLSELVYVDENLSDIDGDFSIPGLDYATFPFYEDLFDHIINVVMPSRGY